MSKEINYKTINSKSITIQKKNVILTRLQTTKSVLQFRRFTVLKNLAKIDFLF